MLPIYDKVAAGGYAGLVSTIVVGVLTATGVTLPPAVLAAIVTLIIFGVSYLKTETKIGKQVAGVADEVLTAMESEGPVKPTDAAFWLPKGPQG